MASDTSKYTKIISIELDSNELIKNLSEVRIEQDKIRQSQQELNQGYKDGKITQEQYANATVKNQEAMKALSVQSRQYSTELQNNIKTNANAKDSINQLRANVANLTAQYNNLSNEQRKSEGGKAMAASILAQTNEIKKANEGIGNFKDNVGDYKNKILDAIGANNSVAGSFVKMAGTSGGMKGMLQAVGAGVAGLGKALLSLIANPIGLVLAAIAVSIMAVSAAIKSSDELGDRWAVTSSRLSRVWDGFMKILQIAAGLILDVVDVYAQMVGKILDLAEKLPFGIGESIKKMNEQFAIAEKMANKANELEDKQREFRVTQARKELEISELRAKAVDKENYTAKERLSFIENALAIEKTIMNEKLRLAQMDYDIAAEKASRNSSSEKDLDALADKEAKLYQVKAESADFERSLSKQRNAAIAQIREEGKEIEEQTMKRQEELSKMDDLAQKYFDLSKIPEPKNLKVDLNELFPEDTEWAEKKAQISDYLKAQEESYKIQILMAGDAEIQKNEAIRQASEARLAYLSSLDEVQLAQQFGSVDAGKIAILEAEKAKQDAINRTAEATQQATEEQLSALADMFGAMSTVLSDFSEQNEAMALLSKGLALVEITLNTGKAISGAIAAAQSVPFPGNLIAIATGITAVLTGITQAKQALSASKMPKNDVKKVKKPKFHTGGEVDGSGEVDATLLGGERVMTIAANTQFSAALSSLENAASGSVLSLSNYQGGQGMEFFKEAFAAALREQKQPVVSVMDIIVAQERINIADTLVKN